MKLSIYFLRHFFSLKPNAVGLDVIIEKHTIFSCNVLN